MRMRYLMGLLALCCPLIASAQWDRPKTANDSLVSAELLSGGKLALRVYAPEARTVAFSGDIWGAKVDFVKDDRGVWEGVLDSVSPGAYRYHFVIDGVSVYDPKAPEASAILKVDPAGDQFFSIKNVPHGAVAQRYYHYPLAELIKR